MATNASASDLLSTSLVFVRLQITNVMQRRFVLMVSSIFMPRGWRRGNISQRILKNMTASLAPMMNSMIILTGRKTSIAIIGRKMVIPSCKKFLAKPRNALSNSMESMMMALAVPIVIVALMSGVRRLRSS